MPPVPATAIPELPTLQQRKQQLVRSAILDAAIDLFVEKGYDETTVDDIAERTGVSRRSFFRYFSSKSDLVASGLADYGDYLIAAIEACPPKYSGREVFHQTVCQVAQQCAAHPRARKMMQVLAKYPAANEAQHSRTIELRERLQTAFARRKRSFGDLDPVLLAGLTLAVLQVIFQSWFEGGEREISATADRVFATLNRLI